MDVVYNGVDIKKYGALNRVQHRLAARGELRLDADQVAVLLVAHNYRLKGAEVFIKSIAEVVKRGHKNVRGIIVGGGKDAGMYEGLAKKLGVGDEISIHGAADHIERYYAAADIYLHPTFYDPMSLVVLEALASELPVITTRLNGASEIMTEGREGFIVDDPRDVPGIVEALEKMLDAKRRDEMAAAARALAEEYPLERNYKGILEVYAKAAAEGPRPSISLRKAK